jgi:hypothetical protein
MLASAEFWGGFSRERLTLLLPAGPVTSTDEQEKTAMLVSGWLLETERPRGQESFFVGKRIAKLKEREHVCIEDNSIHRISTLAVDLSSGAAMPE